MVNAMETQHYVEKDMTTFSRGPAFVEFGEIQMWTVLPQRASLCREIDFKKPIKKFSKPIGVGKPLICGKFGMTLNN